MGTDYRLTSCIWTALSSFFLRCIYAGLSHERNVRPFVCLSNPWIVKKTKETNATIYIPYKRSFHLVFWEKEWWWRATPSTWNFGSKWRCWSWSENANFPSIFARSASAVTPDEKSSINTNRIPTIRFPMSLKWTSYVAPEPPPPNGSSKTQNGRFRGKIAFRLKKVCYKVSLCENCQQQNCKAFIGLSISLEMIVEGPLLVRENLAETHPQPCKTPIFNLFSLVAHQL